MSVTIMDVATKANVSKATVSRVLNNLGGYSEKTKRRVLEVMEELEYNPNAVARSLANKKTHTIGIMFPDLTSSLTASMLNQIEAVAHKAGSSVIVCHTESKGAKTMKYLKLLQEKQVDGIIMASTTLNEEYYDYIKKTNIPVVLLAADSEYPIHSVTSDDYAAAYMATKYLIEKGHKQIGMISGNKEEWFAGTYLARVEGFKAALLDYKLSINEKHIVYGGFSYKDGAIGLTTLVKQVPDLTAIFTENDEIGMGVLSAAYQLGIKVPEDISVIGMDNVKFCEFLNPPLTSVSLSHSAMAEKAANLIFEMIESSKEEKKNYIVSHRVVERQSVRTL